MTVTVLDLSNRIEVAETMARFGERIDASMREYLEESGLDNCSVVGCLEWIWCQWLMGTDARRIQTRVEGFVERGMKMQAISPLFHHRPSHDLFLLHCAIFASGDAQLKELAKRVVNASGYEKYKPKNNGELYESAWCGMVKYWILGDRKKANEQARIVWGAYRFPNMRAAAKPLVAPWLEEDWSAFTREQQKDFGKLWERHHRDGMMKSTGKQKIVVRMPSDVKQLWCWAHCGMALLAHRTGVQIATEPFWLPPHALRCVPVNKK